MEVRVLFIPRSVLIFPVNESERDKEREKEIPPSIKSHVLQPGRVKICYEKDKQRMF